MASTFNEQEQNLIRKAAESMAIELYDESDSTYVGAEMENTLTIQGLKVCFWVCAFWEKSKYFDFKATCGETKCTGHLISF